MRTSRAAGAVTALRLDGGAVPLHHMPPSTRHTPAPGGGLTASLPNGECPCAFAPGPQLSVAGARDTGPERPRAARSVEGSRRRRQPLRLAQMLCIARPRSAHLGSFGMSRAAVQRRRTSKAHTSRLFPRLQTVSSGEANPGPADPITRYCIQFLRFVFRDTRASSRATRP